MQQSSEFDDLEIDNLPNRLTILRIALIPVVIALLYFSDTADSSDIFYKQALAWSAALIFALASITDFFDGYIARKRNIVTVFGSFLDPIADKFLTVSLMIMLQSLGRIPAVVVIILVLREMYMTSLRLLATNEGLQVPVSGMGKWKTAIQMSAIPLLMINTNWQGFPLGTIGTIAIYLACILSIWSAITYTFSMIAKLKNKRKQRKLEKKAKVL